VGGVVGPKLFVPLAEGGAGGGKLKRVGLKETYWTLGKIRTDAEGLGTSFGGGVMFVIGGKV